MQLLPDFLDFIKFVLWAFYDSLNWVFAFIFIKMLGRAHFSAWRKMMLLLGIKFRRIVITDVFKSYWTFWIVLVEKLDFAHIWSCCLLVMIAASSGVVTLRSTLWMSHGLGPNFFREFTRPCSFRLFILRTMLLPALKFKFVLQNWTAQEWCFCKYDFSSALLYSWFTARFCQLIYVLFCGFCFFFCLQEENIFFCLQEDR